MNNVVGQNIRAIRESRAWTQAQLAEAAQGSERTVQRAEDGQPMAMETLQAMAGALDVPIELLRMTPDYST